MLIAYIRIFGFIISGRIGRKISANQNLVKSREMVRWRQVFLAWQLYASDNDPVLAEKKEREKKKRNEKWRKKSIDVLVDVLTCPVSYENLFISINGKDILWMLSFQ